MFFMVDNIDIASYADDNTPYSVGIWPRNKIVKGISQTFHMVL